MNESKKFKFIILFILRTRYDKNGYAVSARYDGRYTCLAQRQYSKSNSYYTKSTISEKCKQTCYLGDKRVLYNSETDCDQLNTCTPYNKILKVVTTPGSAISPKIEQCPIYNTGKSGSMERVRINMWDCLKRAGSSSSTCGVKPIQSDILLKEGALTNLNKNVNGYAIMAKFFGDEVCVSLRRFDYYANKYTCEEDCESVYKEDRWVSLTYNYQIWNSRVREYNSYKFYMTANAVSLPTCNFALMQEFALIKNSKDQVLATLP